MPITSAFPEQLKEVIELSWFTIDLNTTYVYTSVKEVLFPEKHLVVIRDENETTVVTAEDNLSLLGEYKANKEKWKLINIKCGNPFYCVGFIATITNSFAIKGIDIVLLSSFSNDLILVMEKDMDKAVEILIKIGFRKK